MKNDDLKYFESWFFNYIGSFHPQDEDTEANLRYKKEHSLRVWDNMLYIGKALDLNFQQLQLAEIIGLYHDIGRFEQYTRYGTFKDHKSEDHADMGLSILEQYQVLACLDENEIELIHTAIKYHNKRVIPDNLKGDTLLLSQLIRDADKLDILDQIINYYENPQLTPHLAIGDYSQDQGYSLDIINDILMGKQIAYSRVKTGLDVMLIRMAWLLDIKFSAALELAQSKNYVDRLMVFLPQTEDVLRIYGYVDKVIKETLNLYSK